jgi:hypothetical protein
VLSLSELPTIEEVWNALTDRVRANSVIMERLKSASPRLAAATYQDYLWELHPTDRGMRHSLPDEQLLALMVSLYVHQGELEFWGQIFAS